MYISVWREDSFRRIQFPIKLKQSLHDCLRKQTQTRVDVVIAGRIPVTVRNRRSSSRVKISLAGLPVTELGQMKNRLTKPKTRANDVSRRGEVDESAEPDIPRIYSRRMPVVHGQRQLVRFEIVGPLLIQADIIGGVCYLHTLVPAFLVQDRITKKNMENLFGRS